jgi:sugar lactone lactonase YvrE
VYQRVIAALGTLALAGAGAAACSSSSSSSPTAKRPVAKPGQIVTVLSNEHVGANGKNTSVFTYDYTGVAVDRQDVLYVADAGQDVIVKVTRDGHLTKLPAKGTRFPIGPPSSTPKLDAQQAGLNNPQALAMGATDTLFIADTYNNRVRAITREGRLLNVAGTGVEGPPVVLGRAAFGPPAIISGPAMEVRLHNTGPLTFDGAGNLYIGNFGGQLLKLGRDGMVTSVAGTGELMRFSGDGGPATKATFLGLAGVAVDRSGAIFVTDVNRVRRIGTDGIIQTVAGAADAGFAGDGGPPANARFNYLLDVVNDTRGGLLLADQYNNRIRRIAPDGTVSTVAGTGQETNSGDGGPATAASVYHPDGLAVDGSGNIYVTTGDNSVRMIGAPAP